MYTIIGGRGFIGRHLHAYLEARGKEVWIPERADPGLYTRDLGRVIYAAGLTADFRTRPFDTFRAHSGLLTEILDRAMFESLVYLSSTRVYDRITGSAHEDLPIPVDVSSKSDLYNISKLAGESLCLNCGRNGVRVARLSNIIGVDWESPNFLLSLIKDATKGKIELQTSLDSCKDYLLIEDALPAIEFLSAQARHTLYNVASGVNLTHGELVRTLQELTSCAVTVKAEAPAQIFPSIDVRRLRQELDLSPARVLEHIPRLLESFRDGTNQQV